MLGKQPDTAFEELAVEFMMVRLALSIEPDLKGYSHIQTNPQWSYNKQKTIKNAERESKFPIPWDSMGFLALLCVSNLERFFKC